MGIVRRSLLAALAAGALLIPACSSSDSADEGTDPTDESVDAGTGDTTGYTEDTDTSASTVDLPDPCEALTAEELTTATGQTASAEVDPAISTVCNYNDEDGVAILTVMVSESAFTETIIDGNLEFPAPGVEWVEVDADDKAIVAGPPEGRGYVIVGDVGYDVTAGFGETALDATQLEAVLVAIAE